MFQMRKICIGKEYIIKFLKKYTETEKMLAFLSESWYLNKCVFYKDKCIFRTDIL